MLWTYFQIISLIPLKRIPSVDVQPDAGFVVDDSNNGNTLKSRSTILWLRGGKRIQREVCNDTILVNGLAASAEFLNFLF